MTKEELLEAAKAAVGDRGLNYGKPEDNFDRIAIRWRAHIKNRFNLDVAVDASSVAIMCADIKLARLEHQPDHRDSWVDLAGYAACGAEISVRDPEAIAWDEWGPVVGRKPGVPPADLRTDFTRVDASCSAPVHADTAYDSDEGTD